MAYYVGDIPSEDIVIEPARNSEPIDLTPFDSVEVELRSPSFEVIPSAGFLGSLDYDESQVVIEWPGESVLTEPGVYKLAVTLLGEDHRERLAPIHFVVQAEDGWYTLDAARDDWRDAPADDRRLHQLLEIAKGEVIAYAPKLAADTRPPLNYAEGQLMHSRDIWNALKTDAGSSGFGPEGGLQIKAFPLDWAVKQRLRPTTVLGVVG